MLPSSTKIKFSCQMRTTCTGEARLDATHRQWRSANTKLTHSTRGMADTEARKELKQLKKIDDVILRVAV